MDDVLARIDLPRRRFTVEDYHRMAEAAGFSLLRSARARRHATHCLKCFDSCRGPTSPPYTFPIASTATPSAALVPFISSESGIRYSTLPSTRNLPWTVHVHPALVVASPLHGWDRET